MKRRRTSAQRRAALRLAHLGRSIQFRASGSRMPRPRPERDIDAPTPPRWAKMFEGFGPSARSWEKLLPEFDLPKADFYLPEAELPRLEPEALDEP